MRNAADIARDSGPRASRIGPGRWLAHCPLADHGQGQGDRNPSVIVSDAPDMRDGISVTCLAGCSWIDIKRAWGIGGDDHPDRVGRRDRSAAPTSTWATSEDEPDATALKLWRAALNLDHPGSELARRYLIEHRGLTAPAARAAWPPSLRFLPDAIYPRSNTVMPALVAAVARPTDRKVVAVQCTFLRAVDGRKAPLSSPRWTFGRLASGAVRLAPAGDVLALAEGVETAMSATVLSGLPCWAVVGGHRLASVTIPASVTDLHIFADNDEPGRLAAEKCAERHTREGRRVILRYPPGEAGDWNDHLRAAQEVLA